jgi:hypothetical protein
VRNKSEWKWLWIVPWRVLILVVNLISSTFVWISQQDQEFSLLHAVQTSSGVESTSYSMGTGALSPGVKRPGREVDHSPPASAEVKNI